MGAERPEPRRLGKGEAMPGGFLVAFAEALLDRRAQLTRQGLPAATAREQAVAEAAKAFHASAKERDWTVTDRRITGLADDALGLEDELRDRHGHEPELARLFATGEVLEGERAREELPAWLLPDPDEPGRPDRQQPAERTRPEARADRARRWEGGGER